MSILPLSAGIGLALGMISVSTPVQDVIYTASGGIDSQGTPTARTIQAVIDPANTRKMAYLFGGSVADSDILIYTAATLYMDDMYAPGDTRRQSFVTYSGINHRVKNIADWAAQAGMFVYLAERHVAQSGGAI